MGRERPLPPNPPNEDERLAVLHELVPELGLGDGAPEDPMLQSLCKTICKLFKVPIAAVSIVNKDTYSMRACQGLPPQFKIPRQDAFCAWTLLPKEPTVLVIEDMLEDQRFKDHPNVQPEAGGLRFYAGSPLVTSTSHLLGSVCILDVGPRKMSAEDFNMLSNFSEMAIRRLEERHTPSVRANGKMLRTPEVAKQPVVLCDLGNYRWWSVLYANENFASVAGVSHGELVESSFWKLFRPAGQQTKHKMLEDLEMAIEQGQDFSITTRRRESVLDGSAVTRDAVYELSFRPATMQNLGDHAGRISVPNIIAAVELGASNNSYFFAVVTKTSKESLPGPDAIVPSAQAPKRRQQTFYSKRYQNNIPITSKQPVDEGIADVTMGVMCCTAETGLSYRGRWKRKPVVVKVLEAEKKACVRAPAFGVAYVPKEAAMCIGLDHLNILPTFKIVVESVDAERVKTWVVRDWPSVGALDDAITRGWFLTDDGDVDWTVLLNTAIEIAQAMGHLHEENVVFGSLDAYSIQLDGAAGEEGTDGKRHFTVKLQDFSKAVKTEDFGDAGNLTVPSHAAPEVFAKNQISKASDVYAFGMLWWEMVENKLVWPSLTSEQIQKRAASKQLPTWSAEYDPGVKTLMESCLAFKPSQRPTFKQIESRLQTMLAEFQDSKPMRGLSLEKSAAQPAARRLFNNAVSLGEVGRKGTTSSNSNTSKDQIAEEKTPPNSILEKASMEVADSQKKSMFKRFAAKFKTAS